MTAPSEPEGLTPHESLLWRTCTSSLKRFYLPDAGILARRLIWDGQELCPAPEPSPRNTAEVAKALYLLRRGDFPCPLDPDALMERVVNRYLPELEYPDVALALWADALGGGRHFPVLWQALRRRFPSGASDTMELAWTLSALCHTFPKSTAAAEVAALARLIGKKIARNQSQVTGLFYASSRREGWLRRRSALASLSSQTFAVQGLALYARAFNVPEAMQRARRCADAFCGRQGPLGQWWWVYDVYTGEVREPYPVYSVNQDSAVPMALGELEWSGEPRYAEAATRGLSWLFGENELGTSLVDEKAGVIWRAILKQNGKFTILREMYSYHPGRCLYTLCSRALRPRIEERVA
jgi:hypothetical protein